MESALPADKPSLLLFVDRSADSSDTRSKSKEALSAFRELALSNHIKYQMVGQNGDRLGKSVQDYEDSRGVSQHPKLKLSPKSKMIKLKNKMSTMMILNEDKHVTWNKQSSDLRSSLHDILESLLHKKKDGKLSSLAKELGFQLLSDDIDIQLVNTLPSESETQADHDMPKLLNEDHIASDVNIDKDKVELPYEQHPVNSKVTVAELHSKHYEEKIAHVDSNKQLKFAESELFADEDEIDVVGHVKAGETGYSDVDKLGEQQLHHFKVFTGSFFFSDGNYRLVQALTGELEVPAMVIIDPVVQRHYVFPAEKNYSYSSLTDFLTRFLNITLLPYQQSETALHAPREATRPPFVNLDFHEVDSIPQITSNTFSNLVLGNNQSDTDALTKDVLVLFSNRWCGFCQRMELVVCEVYRAMKGYINMLQSGYRSGKTMFDDGRYFIFEIPCKLLYSIFLAKKKKNTIQFWHQVCFFLLNVLSFHFTVNKMFQILMILRKLNLFLVYQLCDLRARIIFFLLSSLQSWNPNTSFVCVLASSSLLSCLTLGTFYPILILRLKLNFVICFVV